MFLYNTQDRFKFMLSKTQVNELCFNVLIQLNCYPTKTNNLKIFFINIKRCQVMNACHNDQSSNWCILVCIWFDLWKLYSLHIEDIPRKFWPFRASTHVSAASYKAARSSVMLYFFFRFLDTKYIAAAPAYFTVIFSVKLKLPALRRENNIKIKLISWNLMLVFDWIVKHKLKHRT